MSEHFIKNIEIKNFKCFEDFKAEGFGRVNLIGGKNNVGKTAFMEACYLSTYIVPFQNVSNFYLKLIEFNTHRDGANLQYTFTDKQQDIEKLIASVHPNLQITREDFSDTRYLTSLSMINYQYSFHIENFNLSEYTEVHDYNSLVQLLNINIKNTKQHYTSQFIVASSSYPNFMLDYIISGTKSKLNILTNQYQYSRLNFILNELFGYQSIDILQGIPTIFHDNKNFPLSQLGQGIKSFIYNIGSILLAQDQVVCIDEIENGLHYSKLDRLWEIILTISKEQNVQVFATTHSIECIESYARVAKKFNDEEIGFIELGRNKYDKLDSVVMDSEMFQRFVKLGNEVRGW